MKFHELLCGTHPSVLNIEVSILELEGFHCHCSVINIIGDLFVALNKIDEYLYYALN